jgi:putative hydrolase
MAAGTAGAVDWSLAERAAREVARTDDRPPTGEERARLEEAFRLAEHWLDAGALPQPPDAGRTLVLDRDEWIDLAIPMFMRLIGPIAEASTEALVALAGRQLGELGRLLEESPDALDGGLEGFGLEALGLDAERIDELDLSMFGLGEAQAEQLREQLRALLASGQGLGDLMRGALDAMGGTGGPGAGGPGAGGLGAGGLGAMGDPGALLRPAAATLNALQAGQVIGQLARQVHGHRDLGVPTAPRSTAGLVAVNVAATFDGYELDATEVAVVLAVTEAAHRRLHHAIGWLDEHVIRLIGRFADAMTVDESQLRGLAEQMEQEIDPDDPDAFQRAIERAGRLRLEPNEAQRAILSQLQVVVGLVGAWARHEARAAVADRLPSLTRIEEVLRRRRAVQGDGEALLAGLLGLDLRPDDESVAERFVATVIDVLGTPGLEQALAHPENLPDGAELADPGSWLARNAGDVAVPDDVDALLAGLGDAPTEASAEERAGRGPGTGTDPQADPGPDPGPDPEDGPDGDPDAAH